MSQTQILSPVSYPEQKLLEVFKQNLDDLANKINKGKTTFTVGEIKTIAIGLAVMVEFRLPGLKGYVKDIAEKIDG